jgi:hypothetical protein
MKTIVLLLLSTATVLTAEAAPAARHPKAPSRRAFAHTAEVRDRSNHMRFRRNPHPLPILDLKAHDPEKFRTVRGAKNYKFK